MTCEILSILTFGIIAIPNSVSIDLVVEAVRVAVLVTLEVRGVAASVNHGLAEQARALGQSLKYRQMARQNPFCR